MEIKKRKGIVMKKNFIKAGLAVMTAVMVMTGCKSSGSNTENAKTETDKTEAAKTEASIELGNYKGLTLTAAKQEVTDLMVKDELKRLKAQYPTVVSGRPAREGDTANIDYVGTKDGVAFQGGTAEGFDLVLGSHTFIDGFEDGVIGMSAGEEKDLNLRFPDNYQSAELAGKDVVFHVTLNAIKNGEETKIDDALAQRVTGNADATLEDLKEEVYNGLVSMELGNYMSEAENELLEQIIADSDIVCDSEKVDAMFEQLKNYYTQSFSQYGADLETGLKYMQSSVEDLKKIAENQVKKQMVLDEIIKRENISATDEQKEETAQRYYYSSAEDMINKNGEEVAKQLYQNEAAVQYLIQNAVFNAVEETTEAEAAEKETTDSATEAK